MACRAEVAEEISGSFFEALKPLKLQSINVANPGQHVTELIAALDAVLKEAVKWAQMYMQESESSWAGLGVLDPAQKDVNYKQAQAFLASQIVRDYLERQKNKEKME